MDYTYEELKRIAKESGRKVTDFVALAPQNDPFYTGSPGEKALAEWFAELWYRLGLSNNVHIRRVHYLLVSQDPQVQLPNGTPYLNTLECWDVLMMAAKHARYLQLVDPAAFVDRKNPVAIEYAPEYNYEPELNVTTYSVEAELPAFPSPPSFDLYSYQGNQRYHVELFCFPPETLVQTIAGPKPISAIQVGEMVLTHNGRYQPVINTFQRPYSGELVRVRARYSARGVRMTPNHQVLTLQGKSSHGGRTAKELAWISASNLVTLNEGKHYKGDYVAFPRIAEQSMPLPLLEPDMSKGGRSDGKGGLLPVEMQNVLIDADVAWMLGFFVGDGYVDARSLHFTLHTREQDIANKLVQIGGRFGLQPKIHIYGNGNTLKVSYHSTRLVNWFRREFGGESNGRSHTGSLNKKFPSWIIAAPQEITEAFLRGYWQADGMNHSAGPGHLSVVTSSINVAEGMRLILTRLGHFPSITITGDGPLVMAITLCIGEENIVGASSRKITCSFPFVKSQPNSMREMSITSKSQKTIVTSQNS
jgi:Hint domain/LAGLIDADG-like domain